MTPQEKRIAIAWACPDVCQINDEGELRWLWNKHPYILKDPEFDPLNDLNAMHEAEKVLTEEQRSFYAGHLESACDGNLAAFFATAAQRADAFLLTLNLMKQ